MPSKKKKYSARFPPARIKKIMQTDEEVGKVMMSRYICIWYLSIPLIRLSKGQPHSIECPTQHYVRTNVVSESVSLMYLGELAVL